MRFRADLHIHTDYSKEHGWHGEKPKIVAEKLYESDLDVAAVLEHNKVADRYNDVREEFAYLQDINKLKYDISREVMILLGCEIACIFKGFLYHVGFIHKLPYKRNDLPEPLRENCNLDEIEEYKKAYPGIAIAFHPAWRDHTRNSYSATYALMQSGVVDGVELINGSIFDNMQRHTNGKKAGEVKKWRMDAEYAVASFLKAKEKLKREGVKLAAIGSSDAHKGRMIGTMYTEFCGRRKEDIFREIKKGNTTAVCAVNGEIRETVKALMNSNRASRFLKVLRRPRRY